MDALTSAKKYDPTDPLDAPHIGERIVTGTRLTLPEEFEALHDVLANQPGVVTGREDYTIKVDGGRDIPLRVAKVRLDALPGHELTFGLDELLAPHDED